MNFSYIACFCNFELVYVHPSSFDSGGLEGDATTGKLYGLSDPGGSGLYEIDIVDQHGNGVITAL